VGLGGLAIILGLKFATYISSNEVQAILLLYLHKLWQ